jgi:hypothetical protein
MAMAATAEQEHLVDEKALAAAVADELEERAAMRATAEEAEAAVQQAMIARAERALTRRAD